MPTALATSPTRWPSPPTRPRGAVGRSWLRSRRFRGPGGHQALNGRARGVFGAGIGSCRTRRARPCAVHSADAARRPAPRFDVAAVTDLPRVDVLVTYQQAAGDLVDAAVRGGARGVVIASAGAGAVTVAQADAIEAARRNGVPVVVASRVPEARLTGRDVPKSAIAAGTLPPVKARIRRCSRWRAACRPPTWRGSASDRFGDVDVQPLALQVEALARQAEQGRRLLAPALTKSSSARRIDVRSSDRSHLPATDRARWSPSRRRWSRQAGTHLRHPATDRRARWSRRATPGRPRGEVRS